MNRKKKFVIATGTFATLFTTIYIVLRIKGAREMADLTPEDRRKVRNARKLAKKMGLREELEKGVNELPEDERNLSWIRTKFREWIYNHL